MSLVDLTVCFVVNHVFSTVTVRYVRNMPTQLGINEASQ